MEQQKTLILIVAVVAIVAIFGIVYLKPSAPLQSQTIAGQAYQANNYRICECLFVNDYYLSPWETFTAKIECPVIKTCETCCKESGGLYRPTKPDQDISSNIL